MLIRLAPFMEGRLLTEGPEIAAQMRKSFSLPDRLQRPSTGSLRSSGDCSHCHIGGGVGWINRCTNVCRC